MIQSRCDNNFNLIRLTCACLVIVAHSFALVDGDCHREPLTMLFHTFHVGELAVFGFFTLSGYLITQSWQRNPKLDDFFRNRLLRIYPGFLVAASISVFVVGPIGYPQSNFFAEVSITGVVGRFVLLHVGGLPPVFPGFPQAAVNSSLWTIKYEFICYIMLAALGVFNLLSRRAFMLGLFTALLILSTIPAGLLPLHTGEGGVLLAFIIRFGTFFLAGSCFQLFARHLSLRRDLAIVAAVVLTICMFQHVIALLALQTCGVYLLMFLAFVPAKSLRRFTNSADVSYGVYLYAWPIQKLLIWYVHPISPYTVIVVTLCLSIVAGWLSWTFIERPFLMLKNRKPVRQIPAAEVQPSIATPT